MPKGARKSSQRYTQRIQRMDKCLTVKMDKGRTLMCWRSPEHVSASDPEKRRHYDPGANTYWKD